MLVCVLLCQAMAKNVSVYRLCVVLCASDRQTLIAASLIVIIIKGVITVPPTHTHTYINTSINSR